MKPFLINIHYNIYIYIESPHVGVSSFDITSEWGRTKVVKLLLEDDTFDPSDALCGACEYGHVAIVRALLNDARIVPNDDSMFVACENGHFEVVELLLMECVFVDLQMKHICILQQ